MLFPVLLACHVLAGLTATACGAAAMLVRKRPGGHPFFGRIYGGALLVVVVTAFGMGVLHRPHVNHLLVVAGIAATAATIGYTARRVRWKGWLHWHISGMALSYIALLTGFYVDNGPELPLWDLLPPVAFWFLPSAIGAPLLARALVRHRHRPRRPSV
ncbi:hypothetical protein MRI28_16985 [Nocardiopsis dassonvillei]|uniref:hypothetical protein n=1 Tax=Nocardiopsis dassonvillei TaxID=2014 RepID=UPI00201025FB|nr:hypothetical protein [Nocardiopsis dassonvillei]MCK9871311.1 hypothetical protein [Nocardiopsis dassonvillei]